MSKIKLIKIECLMLVVTLGLLTFTLYEEYNVRPGFLGVIEVDARGTDHIALSWAPVRNAEEYVVTMTDSEGNEQTLTTSEPNIEINDLKEGTDYSFSVTANSEERKGYHEVELDTSTRKTQTIEGQAKQQRLAGTADLHLSAETPIELSSEDNDVAEVNGDEVILNPGTTTITAVAVEDEDFVEDETEIEVEVLDTLTEESGEHIIGTLDKSNCELVKTTVGVKNASVPQSFAYNDGYTIAYQGSVEKLVNEDGTYTPKIDLGHANGLTYADGKYYSVRGYSSECVECDLENNEYKLINLSRGTSGIAYDEKAEMFYASSRTCIVAYNKDFEPLKEIYPITHSGTYYAQDCGAYSGILMHCISGSNKKGINYVDLYDMVNGKYLGSFKCDLDEVESAIVDDEGYMELLCNTKGEKDCIYKTQINISDLGMDFVFEDENSNE